MKFLFIFLFTPVFASSQWPGYFYSFTLTDSSGKLITVNNKNYTFTPARPANSKILLNVLMCGDSITIRFYEGYKDFDRVQQLEIVRANHSSKEAMVIEFPPSLSGGKEKFYRNLFAGNLIFQKGIYKIKIPKTDSGWDDLQEKHFCPDYGGVDIYYDISAFQKQGLE